MQGQKRHEVIYDWDYRGTETTKLGEDVPECEELNIVHTLREVEVNVG